MPLDGPLGQHPLTGDHRLARPAQTSAAIFHSLGQRAGGLDRLVQLPSKAFDRPGRLCLVNLVEPGAAGLLEA
jgi:hypothetical protein